MELTPEGVKARITALIEQRGKVETEIDLLEKWYLNATGKSLFPYKGKDPTKSVGMFLEELGKWEDEQIIVKAVLDGGCSAGKTWPEVQVKKSINANVRHGNLLRRSDGKIGLPGWKK